MTPIRIVSSCACGAGNGFGVWKNLHKATVDESKTTQERRRNMKTDLDIGCKVRYGIIRMICSVAESVPFSSRPLAKDRGVLLGFLEVGVKFHPTGGNFGPCSLLIKLFRDLQ